MYEIFLKQLDALELNSTERLEIMISIILIKAVELAEFCSLYAALCKHFQNRQVTVRNENDQPVTFFFTEILLTRCQKEFETDYRQEIEYEKRKTVAEAITDDGIRQEVVDQLEEDLGEAKRKKLRYIMYVKQNIIKYKNLLVFVFIFSFFGELFKLQILPDTAIFDCITYLLQDKIDEKNLEYLCKLLTIIVGEPDVKTKENVGLILKNYQF